MQKNFVTIKHFSNPLNADLAKTLLDQAGIPVLLLDRHLPNIRLGNISADVKAQVPQEDVQRALSIVDSIEEGVSVPEPHVHKGNGCHCLKCNALIPEDVDTCGECGWSYQ